MEREGQVDSLSPEVSYRSYTLKGLALAMSSDERYLAKAAEGLLFVDPPGPVLTMTA